MLGLWSACASVGNIIGALLASAVLDYGYDVSRCATVCSFGINSFLREILFPISSHKHFAIIFVSKIFNFNKIKFDNENIV